MDAFGIGSRDFRGNGSRIRIVLHDIRAVFHRPHFQKETDKGAIISMRRFKRSRSKAMLNYKGYAGYVEFDDEAELFPSLEEYTRKLEMRVLYYRFLASGIV